MIYDATAAVRYEDNIVAPKLYSSTFGANVTNAFVEASSDATVFDAKNVLVLAAALPAELGTTGGSLAVDASVVRDVAGADYRLVAGSLPIDRGIAVDVTSDRDGIERPQGSAHDVGAFELCPGTCAAAPDGGGDAGTSGGGHGDDSGGCCQTGRGQAWPALLLVALWLRRRRTRFAS